MKHAKKSKPTARRIVAIVIVALVISFFVASFAIDRHSLSQTYTRQTSETPSLMPTEEFASDYTSRPTEFQMDGATLRGYIYQADNPKGFIIFRHGIFSKRTDYLALICAMVDRGWTVFAYDALGCGISDGDNVKGMPQSALDVAAAVNFVRENKLAGDLPLVLWGHSWGGYGVAAAMDIVPDVDACVTMSGFNSPVDVLLESAMRTMGPAARTQRATLWLNNKLAFGADANRTALDGINKTVAPVLIIHGTNDTAVLYDGSAIIAQRNRITNKGAQYLIFDEPGRNGHNTYFYSKEATAYLNEKSAELEELQAQYPDGIPEEVAQEFMNNYDMARANEADPDFINAIEGFLTENL